MHTFVYSYGIAVSTSSFEKPNIIEYRFCLYFHQNGDYAKETFRIRCLLKEDNFLALTPSEHPLYPPLIIYPQ